MSPEEVEGFWDTLKGVAKQVAPTILPMAGGAVGTLFGGPVGTALGSKLGQMGAQFISGPQKQPAPPGPAPTRPVPQTPAAAPVPPGGTSRRPSLWPCLQILIC